MKAYKNLEKVFKRRHHLEHLMAMAHWDMAVIMPEGGSEARAHALAELQGLLVEQMNDARINDWLGEAEAQNESLDDWQKANLREMRYHWRQATSVSQELVEKKAIAGSKCEHAWRKLRSENNWQDFVPLFKEVVDLVKEEAQQRAAATGLGLYDSMLDLYEPGQSSENIAVIFSELKAFLPGFTQQVLEKQKTEKVIYPEGPYSESEQNALGLELMNIVGFNFHHGRLDVSHHPFCGGVPRDVRITTRYSDEGFSESLMGVLHETGHASYEQGLPSEWLEQPVGLARGMGIHESQSLLYEMQVSRGKEFLEFATAIMKKHLHQAQHPEGAWTTENMNLYYTRVKPDFIRVNADEVTYPAHVILRFEIEKAIIEGQITVEDIPDIWDEKMQEYLGLSTAGNFKDGCMQDIHWTDGSFGYFPTYTLGAMNAAQIYRKAIEEDPQIPQQIVGGEFKGLRKWLLEKIWSKGSFYSIDDLMKSATGESLQTKYFIEHLKARYL